MCRCLNVGKSSYYDWKKGQQQEWPTSRKELLKKDIKSVFEDNREVYGSPRIKEGLDRKGWNVSRAYVGRLMKEMGIKRILRKKFVATTDSKHNFTVAHNALEQNFATEELGKVWVSDITYIKVQKEWAYLTTMIDLADRKVVGWSVSANMAFEQTVSRAWLKARGQRRIEQGFLLHSDQGIQYACSKMQQLFTLSKGMSQSMSRKGNCWDNAVAESFFKTIKHECLKRYVFMDLDQLNEVVHSYMQWYNKERYHSAIGYKTSVEKEAELSIRINKVAKNFMSGF
mgnify:CR=1 FL=1